MTISTMMFRVIGGGGDIQQHQLVSPLAVILDGRFHRVPRVPQAHKSGALDHSAIFRSRQE